MVILVGQQLGKNGAVNVIGEVKKPCRLHICELSAGGVQGGEGDNVRWEVVLYWDDGR